MDDRSIESFSLSFSTTELVKIAPQDFREMVLYRADGSPIGVVQNLLAQRWNSEQIPHEPGQHRAVALGDEETHTDGVLYRVDVRVNVKVVQTLYFGQLPLVEVQGFADAVSGGLITRSFTTADLHFPTVYESWQCVESPGSLAVKPVLTMSVYSHYPEGKDHQ